MADTQYDVLIIGGGVAGLMSALALCEAKLNVVVCEKQAIGRASSWAGGGILSPLYPWRYPDALNRLALYSAQHYRAYCQRLKEQTGIDAQWIQCGQLILHTRLNDPDVAHWVKQFHSQAQAMNPQQIKAIEPQLALQAKPGLYLPEIAQLRNPRLLKALKAAIIQQGVVVLENTALTTCQLNGHRIKQINTTAGKINADKILITAGAWSAHLGLPVSNQPDIVPVKGQMIQIATPPGTLRQIILADDHYLIPRKDGKLLAGSTLEYCGFDKSTDAKTAHQLKEKSIALVPVLDQYPVINHWAGLRPGNARQTPYIGVHPEIDNLYYNTGYFRNGFALGLAGATMCADILVGRKPILPTADYAI